MTIPPAFNRIVNICIMLLFPACLALGILGFMANHPVTTGALSTPKANTLGQTDRETQGKGSATSLRSISTDEKAPDDFMRMANDASVELMRDTTKPWMREALRDPEFRRAAVFEIAQFMEPSYMDLYKLLELDDTGSEALRELLAERFFATYESLMDGIARPNAWLPDVIGEETQVARKEHDAQIAGQLGEEKYALFAEYEKTMPLRNQIRLVREELAQSAEPLTPEQETALLPVLEHFFEGDLMMATMMRSNPLHRPRLTEAEIAALQGVLSEAQLAEIRKLHERQRGSVNYNWKPIAARMQRPEK